MPIGCQNGDFYVIQMPVFERQVSRPFFSLLVLRERLPPPPEFVSKSDKLSLLRLRLGGL